MYADTRRPAPDTDPYSGDGSVYRIWNYRHQVTHRGANPFLIKVPDRSVHFLLDPRVRLDPNDQEKNVSQHTVHTEIDAMFALVRERLEAAIAAI